MENLLKKLPDLTGILKKELHIDIPFEDYVACFANTPGTVILLSGGELDCARYNIAAIEPWLELKGKNNTITLSAGGYETSFNANPLEALRYIIKRFRLDSLKEASPVSAGLFGYLSYDLKDSIEILPRTTMDAFFLPDLYFSVPSAIIVQDKKENNAALYIAERSGLSTEKTGQSIFEKLSNNTAFHETFSGGKNGFQSNFEKPLYIEAVNAIIEYIRAGDIYQANMSQKFTTDFEGSPYALFRHLFSQNPAPFFAYVNAKDHFIVSTSPERFILQTGKTVESRPIKGTRPRSKNPEEDTRLKTDLAASPKDDAELSMIVDLMRNDISKVCTGGSVRVTRHKKIEAYQNVYHLVSIIKGELSPDYDSVDLIRATFPGGSITGCPKIRSMEIIDEQETVKRHVYTGSIGYISFHDTMDFSIAIRTATITGNTLGFSVGGGIVYDSDPEDEYHETLHKGKTLLEAFTSTANSSASKSFIWKNGGFIPASTAWISINTPGGQYGYGLFETLKSEKGAIHYLDEHIRRMDSSWKSFFSTPFPDLSWQLIINGLVKKNALENETAAIKIMAYADAGLTADRQSVSIFITAKKYIHRLKAIQSKGINLVTYKSPRHSFLADHKTMNYMYYDLASVYAKKNGGHEALILNPDYSVSETNTASILFIKGKEVFVPVSAHALPGVMQEKALEILQKTGYAITRKIIPLSEVTEHGSMILTNSLMECVPVLSVDGVPLSPSYLECEMINNEL